MTEGSTSSSGLTQRVHAVERIGSVEKAYGAGVGFQLQVSQLGIQDTGLNRLKALFPLYERWHVHRLQIRWTPALGELRDGTVHMAFDYDPYDPLTTDPTDLAGMRGYRTTRVTKSAALEVSNPRVPGGFLRDGLFTGPTSDMRFSVFGNFLAYVEGVDAELVPGHFDLEYDIELINPQPVTVTPVVTTLGDLDFSVDNKSTETARSTVAGVLPLVEQDGTSVREVFDMWCSNAPYDTYCLWNLITGIYRQTEGSPATLRFPDGNQVPNGTRVYAQLTKREQTWDGNSVFVTNSDHRDPNRTIRPSFMALDPAGKRMLQMIIPAAASAAVAFTLTNVKRFSTFYLH